jgi:hypothetical protein
VSTGNCPIIGGVLFFMSMERVAWLDATVFNEYANNCVNIPGEFVK